MSHQDRKACIVINHQTMKQVVDWLLTPALFAGMSVLSVATWKPRMLAVAALLWATGDSSNLTERFELARKVVRKVFRWQKAPGKTWQGFIKMLRKWHERLLQVICPHLRLQMKEVLPEQWKIAEYTVFAGDGSRVELARTRPGIGHHPVDCRRTKPHGSSGRSKQNARGKLPKRRPKRSNRTKPSPRR